MDNKPRVRFESLLEPRVDYTGEDRWMLLKGGQQSTFYTTNATSYSSNNFNFTVVPPSRNSILDRIVMVQVPVKFTITATNAGTDRILQPGRIALRAYPLNSVAQNVSVNLQGLSNSIQSNAIIHVLSRYKRDTDLQKTFDSIFPSFEDTYQTYDQAFGTSNNPLGGYKDSVCYSPRGSYPWTVTTNTSTQAVFSTVISELMVVPPLIFNGIEDKGLTWLDTFGVVINFNSYLAHMLSISPALFNNLGININNIQVEFAQPQLLMNWITPRDDTISQLPQEIYYPFFQITSYPSGIFNTINSGQVMEVTTSPIQFSSVPLRIYLFAKRSDTDIYSSLANSTTATDTFLQVQNVSINFNNVNGLLSNAAPAQLYQMCYQNGCSMSYPEWRGETTVLSSVGDATTVGTVGSVICIDPSKDFGLDVDLAAGVTGQFSFQAKFTVKNTSSLNFPIDPTIVVVYDGLLKLSNNTATTYISFASRNDVLDAPQADFSYNEVQRIFGGANIFGNLGSVLKKGVKYVKDNQLISKGLSMIPHPIAQAASSAAKSLGYGARAGARGGARAGARGGEHERVYQEDDEDMSYGGMQLTKKSLRDRARR